jgi:hypothetical protein
MSRVRSLALALPLVALAAAPAAAHGGDMSEKAMSGKSQGAEVYHVELNQLNGSGVEGKAVLILKDGVLRVHVKARGLVPGMLHPQHIHGEPGSENATCPPPSASGEDDIITIGEGFPFYGGVLQPLTPFPMADEGTINYHETFMVDGDLTDLSDEAIVLHGAFVEGEYVATLPVACGEID